MSVLALKSNKPPTNPFTKPPIDRTHYGSATGGFLHKHFHNEHNFSHGTKSHGKKNNLALTALTLLSFLFFLNILQNCIKDNMMDQNPQVVVMQAQTLAHRRKDSDLDLKVNDTDDLKQETRTESDNGEKNGVQIPIKLKTVSPHRKQTRTNV